MFESNDEILSSAISPSCHYVSTFHSFSSGKENPDFMGVIERLIATPAQPRLNYSLQPLKTAA